MPTRRCWVAGDAITNTIHGLAGPVPELTLRMLTAGESVRKLSALESRVIFVGRGPQSSETPPLSCTVRPAQIEPSTSRPRHLWEEYSGWHLGLTIGARDETKARYAFVYGDFHRVHRTGLIAFVYRAAEWRHKQVELAAHDLLQRLERVGPGVLPDVGHESELIQVPTIEVDLPDELAEQIRKRELPVSAMCQRALRAEISPLQTIEQAGPHSVLKSLSLDTHAATPRGADAPPVTLGRPGRWTSTGRRPGVPLYRVSRGGGPGAGR